ncbi:MAG: hypothetical protein O9340_10945 [Cyclobacteriaceae bacterium]|jgi:hypothetical protein|nr:hypothetical protein [Cyclobacteriaceae bacterium]
MITFNWLEVIGWLGSLQVVIAYGLNSYQKLKSDSYGFLLLNLFGGLFLIAYTFYKDAYASMFLNIVWVIIALPALIKLMRKI